MIRVGEFDIEIQFEFEFTRHKDLASWQTSYISRERSSLFANQLSFF